MNSPDKAEFVRTMAEVFCTALCGSRLIKVDTRASPAEIKVKLYMLSLEFVSLLADGLSIINVSHTEISDENGAGAAVCIPNGDKSI